MRIPLLLSIALSSSSLAAPSKHIEKRDGAGRTAIIGTCGVSAQHLFLGTSNKLYIVDKTEANPLMINGVSAAAAEYDLKSNTCRAMPVKTNQFCAGGGTVAGGGWVSAGGNPPQDPNAQGQTSGLRDIRSLTPCENGLCQWASSPSRQLQVDRWYPAAETMPDGSLAMFGGYNAQVFLPIPASGNTPTVEYIPSKGKPVTIPILSDSLPFSLYPLTTVLSDGQVLIVAGNKTALFNPTTKKQQNLPNMPNGPRTYPSGGSSVLFPMSPLNNYQQTVMFCGGTNLGSDWGDHYFPPEGAYAVPANNKCDLISPLTDPTWSPGVDMPSPRVMGNFVILPTAAILLTNGAEAGVQGFGSGPGDSQATIPANTPYLFDPVGRTWEALAQTNVNRGYHSSAQLLPDGSVVTGGSSPHWDVDTESLPFPTEYRLEVIYPPYYDNPRPSNTGVPTKFGYKDAPFSITFKTAGQAADAKVRIIRSGWSTHGLQMGQRALDLPLVVNGTKVTFSPIPNSNLFPPGAALAFLVVNGIPSTGKYVVVG